MPTILNKAVDSLFMRIRRMPMYYKRYNNTLPLHINQAYMRYARDCSERYAAKHGMEEFAPCPLFTDGAMRLKGVFPREKALAYSAKMTELIEKNDEDVEHPKGFSDLQIRFKKPLQSLGSGFLDVFHSPDVHKAMLSFFRGDYRIEWISVFRSVPAERVVSSWMWHSDSYPPRTCKLFLHFTPATAETGATNFMNLEDTMAYRRAGYFGQYLGERYADLEEFAKAHGLPYRPFHFDAEPGDATIFDQNFFHRAVSPLQGFRDVVQFFLLPNQIPWHEQLQKDGLESLSHVGSGYPKDPQRRG